MVLTRWARWLDVHPGPTVVQVDADGGVQARTARARERLAAHLHAESLGRALAAGVCPEPSVPLALRAQELAAPSTRRMLAASLRRIVQDAEAGAPRWNAYGLPARPSAR